MHTGREGMAAMPFLDEFDLSTVDILLISQYVPSTLPQLRPVNDESIHIARMRHMDATLGTRALVVIW